MITTNKEFLQAVLGECWEWAHVTSFTEDPAKLDELGLRHYWGGNIYFHVNAEDPNANNFFTISTFTQDPEDGKHRRRKSNFAAAFCMMIDDIGTGPGAKIDPYWMGSLERNILPSWELETSPGNWQYGYIFDQAELDPAKVNALLKGLVALGMVDGAEDPGMLGVTRYARLPIGSNTKAKYGQPFQHRLTAWHPERRHSIEQIAEDFGINLQDHYNEIDISEPIPKENDLIYQSLERLGLVKATLREGIYDIVCPWIGDHTDRADSGAAYLSPMGFKCHHGHCASRTGRDLLNYLHGADEEYVRASEAAQAAAIPFVVADSSEEVSESLPSDGSAKVAPEQLTGEVQNGDFEHRIQQAIQQINPNEPNSVNAAYEALAAELTFLSPTEKEHWLRLIKDEAQITIKTARDQLKHVRYELLKENRKKGILHEPAWIEFNDDKIVPCLTNFKAMCEYHGIELAYNQMTHSLDLTIPGVDHSGEDEANRDLTYMRDLVQKYGLAHARVDEWMVSLAHEHPYHPFRDYLDQQRGFHSKYPFDPTTPAFYKVLSTLKIEDHVAESETFIRRWFISLIAAVRGSGNAGLKGVLTLAGKQNIGKTSWFREVIPKGMFSEGVVLDVHNKDTIIQATNHLVCELGELDATFKRDIPAFKAFISKQEDDIRHPYAAKSSKHPRRTVFCATVNQTKFLVDQTGNSRFWPIMVENCDFQKIQEMTDSGEIDQFWYEVDMMYESGCAGVAENVWWIGAEESAMLDKVSEEYIRHSPGETLLREHFDMEGPLVHWMSNEDIMGLMGLRSRDPHYVTRSNEVYDAIRRITGGKQTRKMANGVRSYGYMMPQARTQKMVPALAVVPPQPKIDLDFL